MAVVRFVGLSVAGVLYGVIFAFILGGLFYFLAESAGYLWLPLALPVYGLLLLLLLLALLVIPSLTRNMVRRASMPGRRSDLFFAISVVIGYPLVFIFISGQFLRYWSLQFGGFSPRGGDYFAWTVYAVSWLLDNGLGNFGQIFGWDISPIHPINDTARSVVWIYNVALEFLGIAAVVKGLGVVAGYWKTARGQGENAEPPAPSHS